MVLMVLWLGSGAELRAQGQTRAWTDVQGRTVQAAYGGVEGDQVLLKMANGNSVPFAISRLSAADQAFIKSQVGPKAALTPSVEPVSALARLPFDQRTFPDKVDVPVRTVDANATLEKPEERKFIYQTEKFEFSSQAKLAKSVMTEVAQTFEATRLLLNQLPWGLDCRPPDGLERYQAKLFETRADYIAAGGPENSGGVYMNGLKVFMVPFQSIGLVKRGQTYFKNSGFRNDTLVHEITHQVMDEYLSFLPTWIIEGAAEYTEMMPDTANGFLTKQHGAGIRDYIKSGERRLGAAAEIPMLEGHMTMDRDTWQGLTRTPDSMFSLYYRSCILVYFFNHLDGDGKGTQFMKYMDAVYGEVQQTREFFANPEVKRSSDGRFTYPQSLTPPDFRNPFKHLGLLLNGRGYSELMTEIETKYKAEGIRIKVK
jgi:hypothetical protein